MSRPILILLAALGIGTSAQAQLAPGRSGGSTVSYFGAEQAMKELTVFGRCYARNKADKAWTLIAARPASREEAQIFRKLFKGESEMCLIPGTTLTMPLEYIRGVIAEGLLREQVPVPAAHRLAAPTLAEVRSLTDIARCFVAANPAKARTILETKPGSRAEYEAVSALIGDFAPCTPAGAQVRADATLIRYRLAEGLLRLTPPIAPGS